MNTLIYWLCVFLGAAVSIVPGLVITSRFNLKQEERFVLSFGFSFLIMLALTPMFLAGFALYGYIIMLLFFIVFIGNIRNYTKGLKNIFLLFLFVLVLYSSLQTVWEYPVMGGDWLIHGFIVPESLSSGPPAERPPLFNLIIFSFHEFFVMDFYAFWLTQIVTVIANGIIVLSGYLAARKFLNKRLSMLAALFMAITPFIAENSIFVWPKYLAAYFVLLMIYFLFFEKRTMLAGLMAGLAFLSHSYAIIFIASAFLLSRKHWGLPRNSHAQKSFAFLMDWKKFLPVFIACLLPWLFWTYVAYGTVQSSNFIYYPISVGGYSDPTTFDKTELWSNFVNTPAEKILGIRAANAVLTLTPAMAFVPSLNNILHFSENTEHWAYLMHFYHSLPGALTIMGYAFVLLWLAMWKNRGENEKLIFKMFILSFVFILVFVGWIEYGLARQTMQPMIPFFIIFAFLAIERAKLEKILPILFIACIIEGILFASMVNQLYIEVDKGTAADYVTKYIPGFEMNKFTSAHFFADPLVSIAISAIFIIFILYLLHGSDESNIHKRKAFLQGL